MAGHALFTGLRLPHRSGLRHVLSGCFLLAIWPWVGGCSGSHDEKSAPDRDPSVGRNVLIVTLDTTRADHLGAYGYPLDITPEIDRLAERGVLFENAYAPMPQTLPSHTTLMTGLQPRQHGALENTYTVDESVDTMAEQLGREGYATAAFVSALALSKGAGIHQGFEIYDQPRARFDIGLPAPAEREASEMTDIALAWAETQPPEQPFFLWVHYFDPHADHVAPRRYLREMQPMLVRDQVIEPLVRNKKDVAVDRLTQYWRSYASEVRYMDDEIGRLLDGLSDLGLLDETVIVLAGDHGEGLYEHGNIGHGMNVWEELHRVPLILVDPDGKHAGTRIRGRVELADVLPTVMSMSLGRPLEGVPGAAGLDLWSWVEKTRSLPQRPVFLERPHFSRERIADRNGEGSRIDYGELVAVLMGDYKLVRWPDGRERLFDLSKDPDESKDLVEEQPEMRARLAQLMDGWLAQHAVDLPGAEGELSDERTQALKALGYLGDG
ncbi:MAG: sulfatase [Planctomycetota bacterium]|jgi:arylsulfatase A-like enzyme|nr:sulfatase [Planctomycetota bacterium]